MSVQNATVALTRLVPEQSTKTSLAAWTMLGFFPASEGLTEKVVPWPAEKVWHAQIKQPQYCRVHGLQCPIPPLSAPSLRSANFGLKLMRFLNLENLGHFLPGFCINEVHSVTHTLYFTPWRLETFFFFFRTHSHVIIELSELRAENKPQQMWLDSQGSDKHGMTVI